MPFWLHESRIILLCRACSSARRAVWSAICLTAALASGAYAPPGRGSDTPTSRGGPTLAAVGQGLKITHVAEMLRLCGSCGGTALHAKDDPSTGSLLISVRTSFSGLQAILKELLAQDFAPAVALHRVERVRDGHLAVVFACSKNTGSAL